MLLGCSTPSPSVEDKFLENGYESSGTLSSSGAQFTIVNHEKDFIFIFLYRLEDPITLDCIKFSNDRADYFQDMNKTLIIYPSNDSKSENKRLLKLFDNELKGIDITKKQLIDYANEVSIDCDRVFNP